MPNTTIHIHRAGGLNSSFSITDHKVSDFACLTISTSRAELKPDSQTDVVFYFEDKEAIQNFARSLAKTTGLMTLEEKPNLELREPEESP